MKKEFTQKKGLFNKRIFILSENDLSIEFRDSSNINRYNLKLDEIGYQKNYIAKKPTASYIFGGLFIASSLILFLIFQLYDQPFSSELMTTLLMFPFIFGLVAFLLRLNEYPDDIVLIGGKYEVKFYRNKPNEDEVSEFINQIIIASKDYLKKKYIRFEKISEEEFFNTLEWLKSKDIISISEFHLLIEEFQKRQLLNTHWN